MARESLTLLLTMFVASGCLVADPPEYQPPAQTPPMLDLFQAVPPVWAILPAPLGANISFNVPVRSEDAGDDLLAALYIDFGTDKEDHLQNIKEEASTFDDDTRAIDFPWTVAGVGKGCHQLSLLVTHRENFDDERLRPSDSNDQDIAIWWVNVDPDEANPNTLADCETVSKSEP